jgi:D-xylose transport system substrate-binding protein
VLNLRNILMIASLALSVLIGLVLSRGGAAAPGADGKGGPSASSQEIVIGLSLDTLKEARWQADRDMFVEAAGKLGAKVLVQAANSDDARQMQDVEALVSRGVRALVIVPHDSKTMARAVEVAHKSKIPVIAYDRMIRESDVDLYVSFDNAKIGEQQAEWLLAHLPNGKGKIVRIHGAPTDDNARILKEGQDRVLKPAIDRGDVVVVHEDWAEEWKPENGKKIVNAAITRVGRSIDAVLAANDGTAGGAIQALTEEGIAGKVLVTGQDAELAALQRVAAGTQTMTIYKPLKVLTTNAATAAVKLARAEPVVAKFEVANGKKDVPSILSSTIAVDAKNLESTIVKDGFHTKDEIYRGVAAPAGGAGK